MWPCDSSSLLPGEHFQDTAPGGGVQTEPEGTGNWRGRQQLESTGGCMGGHLKICRGSPSSIQRRNDQPRVVHDSAAPTPGAGKSQSARALGTVLRRMLAQDQNDSAQQGQRSQGGGESRTHHQQGCAQRALEEGLAAEEGGCGTDIGTHTVAQVLGPGVWVRGQEPCADGTGPGGLPSHLAKGVLGLEGPEDADHSTSLGGITGGMKISPSPAAPKDQLPCGPERALLITEVASPAAAESAVGPRSPGRTPYLEEALLAEFTLVLAPKMRPPYGPPSVWFRVVFIQRGLDRDAALTVTVQIPENDPVGDCPCLGWMEQMQNRGGTVLTSGKSLRKRGGFCKIQPSP
ncbi:AKT-interacting protein [Camelus dromedarius]|uniref:AKT-interacting protein n=1 Tax=Camelus dromedarius TaxID=9838 RepID=A0A5N4E2G3_CAMDR|nr:AKT-interacting protein [Camelus dromedarius]